MTHALEGDLLRWMDGEAGPEEDAALAAHLAACAACRALLGDLQRYDAAWRRAVPLLDDLGRPARRLPRLAWAASILLLFGVGVGVGVRPVRAWIVTQGRALWEAVVGAPAQPAPVPAARPVSRVQFAPAEGAFGVTVMTMQAGGTLVLEPADDTLAVAWVVGDGADADLIVLPDGLRIRNHPAATATYHVRVPGGRGEVEVRVGPGRQRVRLPGVIPLDGRNGGGGSLTGQEDRP